MRRREREAAAAGGESAPASTGAGKRRGREGEEEGAEGGKPGKKRRKGKQQQQQQQPERQGGAAAAQPPPAARQLSALQAKMKTKLKGAQFRWLNEQLYTRSGGEALEMMQADPSHFEAYHDGFRSQAAKWPVNPLDHMIRFVRRHPRLVVGDFGCGEARLAAEVPNKVHSFDLVAANERITACDIASVPLPDAALDVAVFCLSLMGTTYAQFLREAHRTLKKGGVLRVAEVESRLEGRQAAFERAVCGLGFRHVSTKPLARMFVMFDFVKTGPAPRGGGPPAPELKPCRYKRR